MSEINRRDLIKVGALSAALSSCVSAQEKVKLDQLRLAVVGYGSQGHGNVRATASHKNVTVVAIADPDRNNLEKGRKTYGKDIQVATDYRQIYANPDSFDAVLIATPDHMHAKPALEAMDMGKHIYLQKPLAQEVLECRELREKSEKMPHLATQMGIQIHAHAAYRSAVKWIKDGIVGKVSEVHSWSGKGWGGNIPQKPAETGV